MRGKEASDRNSLFCNRNLNLVILKLQETLFFVSNFRYFISFTLKPTFSNIFMSSFKANLEMKKHQFSFELISIVIWKPIPVNDPRATMLC